MTVEPFVIERSFNAPAEKIWKAISDKEQMKQWYFDLKEFEPKEGFQFTFEGGDGTNTFLHLCEVLEVEPNKKLQHSWRYDGFEGNSFVTWELLPEGDGKTKVRLTHEGLETFPADNPSFARSNFEAGWTAIVGTNLGEYLAKS
ncbi:MAG: hypothetical protein K0S09_2432 [Sphingobacteriaceae bacterium]|jgi:uncharacterized protein YndB with AHSA1/START domain|nr:hypothetical protein [Sphingobacteriaceae bacterium]